MPIHHIIPRCLGGTDDPSNLIELSYEEHVEAHRILMLENPSHKGLAMAYYMMSGQKSIGASLGGQIGGAAGKGRKQSPETIAKRVKAVTGMKKKPHTGDLSRFTNKTLRTKEKHHAYDPVLYNFHHKDGYTVSMTKQDFCRTYNVASGNLAKHFNGKHKTVKSFVVEK
jgi:hypothetical protein